MNRLLNQFEHSRPRDFRSLLEELDDVPRASRSEPAPRPTRKEVVPTTFGQRAVDWLFWKGGMSMVLVFGLAAIAVIAALLTGQR
jgi:hypothetical protein